MVDDTEKVSTGKRRGFYTAEKMSLTIKRPDFLFLGGNCFLLKRSPSHLPTHANLREFWSTQACEPGSTDNGLLLVGNLDDNKHGKGASALTHILILDASSVFFFSLLC